MARPIGGEPRNSAVSLRLTMRERQVLGEITSSLGFSSISEYLRHLLAQRSSPAPQLMPKEKTSTKKAFSTRLGTIYLGDSLHYMSSVAREKSVRLIVTSPPFGLVRKKTYGNEDADQYCEWFRPFAAAFKRVLKDDGSLVIDIGGAWKPGTPTRSLYHFELLVMLCREYGFHLCQEHFWWNPAKLPTPAEWVNVRRIRVKDAVNCVWWLSPTPYPRANNRRVLTPYSPSMRDLLINGYSARERPSGHIVSDKFQRDNGGAVPPNLLAVANTESNSHYQEYCRANNVPIHPARFPALLPEYFVRLLSDPGELVLDPFGGSCVTGSVCEALKRRWACVELRADYVRGAVARLVGDSRPGVKGPKSRPSTYSISTPCSTPVDDYATPLIQDGGRASPASSRVKKARNPRQTGRIPNVTRHIGKKTLATTSSQPDIPNPA